MRSHKVVLCLTAVGMVGCALSAETSHTRSQSADLGSLGLAIAMAPGLDIAAVNYSVQVPGLEAIEGTLPVAADGTLRGKIDDIPAADAVLVVLKAVSASGATCTGQGTVAVRVGEVASLSIGMQCRVPISAPVPTTGSISVQATFDACPRVLAASASPTATTTSTAVTANAEDLDGDVMSFSWSANAGTFAGATLASTTYTCAAAGDSMLTVTVDDGRGCTDSKVVLVTCNAPPPPPPPTCGDGKQEGDEACDDGNTSAGDGCSPTCAVEQPAPAGTDIPCDVQAILQVKCQGCHGDPPTSGPMALVTLAQLHADSPGANAGTPVYLRVKERINHVTSPMPPAWGTTGPLSETEKDTLNDWLLAGAPGATCPAPL